MTSSMIASPFGQAGATDPSTALVNLRTDIIPHSPEAEALGKYGVIPVTLYSGLPNVSIPIYEIKTPSLDLPFSLGYNSNGYKPNEIASYVGMGWSVQGGGSITRIVKDQVDESLTSGRYDNYINNTLVSWSQPFLQSVAQKEIDGQPDIYIFNVGGYRGKFILLKGKAYLYPQQNIVIEPYNFNGFKLTDDNGNVYLFTDIETTYQKQMLPGNPVPDHTSAWYVSKIISADTKDTVTFAYTPYYYRQPNNYVETYTINTSLGTGLNTNGHTYTEYAVQGDHIDALLLSGVFSKYGNINFLLSGDDRTDLIGSSGAKYLDNIVVTGGDGTLAKQMKLNHGYFGSGYNQRLNLQSVTFQLPFPQDSSRYSMEYYGGSLPDNGTKGVDTYGYYNAKQNAMLFPAGTFTPSLYSYGDRSANAQASILTQLSKITYPTGGYSTFEYEQNQYGSASYQYQPDTAVINYDWVADTLPGGLMRRRFAMHLDTAQEVKISCGTTFEFDPGNTTVILNITKGALPTGKTIYSSQPGVNFISDSLYLDPGDYWVNLYLPKVGRAIAGQFITLVSKVVQNTLSDGPGLRIRKITSYDYNGIPQLVKQYTYSNAVGLEGGGVSGSNMAAYCGQYNIISYMAGLKGALYEYSGEQFFYTQVEETTQDSLQTGKTDYTFGVQGSVQPDVNLLSQTDYQYKNGKFIPVQQTTHDFSWTLTNDFLGIEVIPTGAVGNVCTGCWGCSMLQSPDPTQDASLLTIYGVHKTIEMQDGYALATHDRHIEYDSAGQAALQTNTNYYYDNPSHLYPTRITATNSKGEQQTVYLKYPLDYSLGQSSSLKSLDSSFHSDLGLAANSGSSCLLNEEAALSPFQPYTGNTSAKQQQFTTIANGYNCVSTYAGGVSAAVTNRNNAWGNYFSTLDGLIASNSIPWQRGVLWMQRHNMISPWIEKYVTIKKPDNNEYLVSATRNEYNIFSTPSSAQTVLASKISQVELSAPLLFSTFSTNTDAYYLPQLYYGYDSRLNLASQNKVNGKLLSYLWDYRDAYPIAQVTNSDPGNIAYTSFEADGNGTVSINDPSRIVATDGITGSHCYSLDVLSRSNLDPSKSYIISVWAKNGTPFYNGSNGSTQVIPTGNSWTTGRSFNGWTYLEKKMTGVSDISLTGSGVLVDEVRIYPADALMTTYTYAPSVGITSLCDQAGQISYYGYDALGRLKTVKDEDGNIIKTIEYHFKKQ